MSDNGAGPWETKRDSVVLSRDQAMQTREGLLLQVEALEKSMGIQPTTSELRRCYYYNQIGWGADLVTFRKIKGKKKHQRPNP